MIKSNASLLDLAALSWLDAAPAAGALPAGEMLVIEQAAAPGEDAPLLADEPGLWVDGGASPLSQVGTSPSTAATST